jgi:vitamin B12 transporter
MRRILFPALIAFFPVSALAQSQIPEMVITATRVPTPLTEIPAGVTVIDRATMEAYGQTDLVQVLAAVPGLRVAQSGGPGGNASVFIRGTNSNHVLVLRDGMPMNDAADSSGAFNFGVDTLADVERVEIIRGPMAALYGSGAIGGVINFITRKGTEPGPHISGELAGGYPRQIQGNIAITGTDEEWDYAAIAESQSQQGFDTVPQRMSVFRDVPQGFRTLTGTLNLGFTPEEGTRFSLLLRARSSVFGFDAMGFPTFDDANSTGRADSLLGRVGATTKFLNGAYETGIFVGRLQDDRHYTQTLNALDPNQATNDSRYRAERTDIQWNNTLHLTDYLDSPALSATDLTFGYAHTADAAQVAVNSSFFGFPYAQSAQAYMDTDAGHAGLQTTLWNRLTLTGQVRQDAVLGQTPFTWRTGAVLALPEFFSRLKTAYGTAFRAPSLFDRYGVDSFGYVGNPNLRPETSEGWEVGFVSDIPAFARADFLSFGATYFNNRVHNLIITQFFPVYTSVNVGAAHMQGVETEFSLRPTSWLTARFAWTYTDARDATNNSPLLRRPQNSFSATLLATPLPGLTIAPELLYTGHFRDFLNDNNGFPTNVGTSPSGLILNLDVTYALNPKISLFAAGRNLTNSRFEPVNGFQTPGASFLVGTRIKL